MLSGYPVSLICGYDLKSNPPATVSWTDPLRNSVTTNDNTEVIQFYIAKASPKNNGTWICTIHQNGTEQDKSKHHEMIMIVVCKFILSSTTSTSTSTKH